MVDFSINFSRPGNQVVAQYYNFLRLGMEGYRRIQQSCQDVALYLSGEIAKLGPFELITDHETATGTSTIGSSEAAMLGGMALKWNWRDKMNY